jgi:hypothetical protein
VADRILFNAGTIESMDPYDTSTQTTLPLKTGTDKKHYYFLSQPRWSPNGTHIVFEVIARYKKSVFDQKCDLHRATATGTDQVNLTEDVETYAWLMAWVSDD